MGLSAAGFSLALVVLNSGDEHEEGAEEAQEPGHHKQDKRLALAGTIELGETVVEHGSEAAHGQEGEEGLEEEAKSGVGGEGVLGHLVKEQGNEQAHNGKADNQGENDENANCGRSARTIMAKGHTGMHKREIGQETDGEGHCKQASNAKLDCRFSTHSQWE